MNELRVSLIQSDIIWEDKAANLRRFHEIIASLKGKSDIAILPEMFTTGFSVKAAHLAETNEETTVTMLLHWAKTYDLAVAGSFLAKNESGGLFNRGFFITPAGETFFYDKRHLFCMGSENLLLTAGDQRFSIIYKDWRICLIICYDLRFPVWCRNENNDYDLLICTANWPEPRAEVWEILLKARALENQCYVCGVNRIGKDGNNLFHQGDSMMIDFKGKPMNSIVQNKESIETVTLNKFDLNRFRENFPAWKDADSFEIK
jgi:predicted amidohydrolase